MKRANAMERAAGVAALVGVVIGAQAHAAEPRLTGVISRETVPVKGGRREFLQYLPTTLKPGAPLLFVFHGSGGDGESMREATGFEFDQLADRDGFVVVYPEGYQATWNDCRKASPQAARVANIDDESFVEAIIAKEATGHAIDRGRVFSAGWSNGGQLGYRLALERANEFAGVAAISASLPKPGNLACTPSHAPMPVLIINGTADPINPFDGGDVRLGSADLGPVYSSRETAEYWAKLNGIAGAPAITHLAHKNASDPSVDEMTWSAPGKFPVALFAVNGGGHVVPQRALQDWGGLGRQTRDLDAPVAIWDFFSKLPARK
jgi:polyhydroxybutyrate depolymerase